MKNKFSGKGLAWISLVFFLTIIFSIPPVKSQARPKTIEELAGFSNHLVATGVKHGSITTIYKPRFNRVQEANLALSQEEVVFVVMLPGGPRIYPQRIMVWHQVVNDVINDHAYAITYCPTSGTLMAYDASMAGQNLEFDIDGRLYEGNTVLIDRNTGSLWVQASGRAFEGALLGRGMPTLPVFWTTWGLASRFFSNAMVLAQPPGRRPYGRDPYGSYLKPGTYYDDDNLIYPVQRKDRRLHPKTPMLCLELDEPLVGIDIKYVKKKGTVNFFVGSLALLAVHDRKLDVIRIYDRQIWAEPFLFVLRNGVLTDINTRSTWDPVNGTCTNGKMQGSSMKQLFGGYNMWFAWYSMNPETFVIPGPGEVPEKLLSLDPPGAERPGAAKGKQ